MRYLIDMALFGALPDYTRVLLALRGLDNTQRVAPSLNLLHKAAKITHTAFAGTDPGSDPQVAVWRQAASMFSIADEQPVSLLDTLLSWATAGRPIPNADPLTNLLRGFALQNRIPVGGDDLDRLSGNVWLRPSRGNELFVPLNRPEYAQVPGMGEIINVDDATTVLCRHWNATPGDRTRITSKTRNALVYLDALPPVNRPRALSLGERLARLLTGFLGGEVEVYVLTADQPAVQLRRSNN